MNVLFEFMNLVALRRTADDKLGGTIRVLLGLLFLMTGAMKLVVPTLADAWSGQLIAAELPFYTLSRWSVPFVEMAIGVFLLVGAYARLAGIVVVGIMFVATYVHLVVDDPALFPLQPNEPVVPIVVVALTAYILWRGAGAWSSDLRASTVGDPTR